MNNPEKAVSILRDGFSCSQAILATFCEKFGLDKGVALKLADAFGGGMGRMGLTCGAVTGAFMVIGLRHGRMSAGDREAKEETIRLVREFVRRFKSRNETIVCRELPQCDIGTDEGFKHAEEQRLVRTLCPAFVAHAAEILDEIM